MENLKDPYCEVCGGCGEDGCCPAEICQQKEHGLYCEWYLKDLKFHSKMFKDTVKLLEESHSQELEKIYDENYDIFY